MIIRRALIALVVIGLAVTAAPAAAAVPSWTTYRRDAARGGVDPDSSSPLIPTQAWQTSSPLDGDVYGQPLVYGSSVFVATENDTVYALDATTGAVIWQRHLATAVPAGELPCGDIGPTVGITSTPVIDPATGAIYVVADTWDGTHADTIHHELFGLSIADGAPAPGLPIVVDPPSSTPPAQLQRPGLALDEGKVIIGYGGNAGDCGTYNGWLVAAPEHGGSLETFEVEQLSTGGAIWGSGNAPPVDSSGDIWVSSGNGFGSFDHQESVLKLDPNLHLLDYWAPANWLTLDNNDTDLGSSEPILLPDGLVFEIGKEGVGILLSTSSLGGTGAAPVFETSVCGGSWGGGVYYNGIIYVTCSDGIRALELDLSSRTFVPLATWTVTPNAIGPPIVAGGMVWSVGFNAKALYGLDPQSGAVKFSSDLGSVNHFVSPSAAGGMLFVPHGRLVTAWKIATPPPPSSTGTALVSSSDPSGVGGRVTFTASVGPAPDAGTVRFTSDGVTISGCSAVSVAVVSGKALCDVAFTDAGTRSIVAAYSGDAYYTGSRSAALQQMITASPAGPGETGPPSGGPTPTVLQLTRARVRHVHGQLELRVTLSEPATITATFRRRVAGRLVMQRCRPRARHGRHCHMFMKVRRVKLRGTQGSNLFRFSIGRLRAGRYALSLLARDRAGQSRRVVITFTLRR